MVGVPSNIPTSFDAGFFLRGIQTLPYPPLALVSGDAQKLDMALLNAGNQVQTLQSVFIDNSVGNGFVFITALGTGQFVKCPPFSSGWFPLVINSALGVTVLFAANDLTGNGGVVALCFSSAPFSQGPWSCIPPYGRGAAYKFSAAGAFELVPALFHFRVLIRSLEILLRIKTTAGKTGNISLSDGTDTYLNYDWDDAALGLFVLYRNTPSILTGLQVPLTLTLTGDAPFEVTTSLSFNYVEGV